MRINNHTQGSDEWLQSRLGKPTASNFGKLITPTGKPSTSAEGYINDLIAQKITGELPEFYTNEAMARGNELEPAAKAMYEFMHGVEVVEVGLCLHDEFECGASPDGLVGDDGLVEIAIFHARGTPQGASTGHIAAVGGSAGTILRHGRNSGLMMAASMRVGAAAAG